MIDILKKIQSARNHRRRTDIAYEAIAEYCDNAGIAKKHKKALQGIIEENFYFKKGRIFIDIAPDSNDAKFFFINSFSLNKKHTTYAIKSGYRKTMEILG